jgi:hypothetical protein
MLVENLKKNMLFGSKAGLKYFFKDCVDPYEAEATHVGMEAHFGPG